MRRVIFLLTLVMLITCPSCGTAPLDINQVATQTAAAARAQQVTQPPPVESPSAAPPTQGVNAPPGQETFQLQSIDPSSFTRYSMSMNVTFDGTYNGQPASGGMEFRQSIDTPNQAAFIEMTFTGSITSLMGEGSEALTPGTTRIVFLNNITYTTGTMIPADFPGVCIAIEGGGAAELVDPSGPFAPENFFPTSLPAFSWVGPGGEVNGVQTTQYHLEGDALISEGEEGLQNVSADVWVADQGGYVVRLRMTGSPPPTESEQGTMTMEYNLLSIDQPLAIQMPPECAGVEPIPASGGSSG